MAPTTWTEDEDAALRRHRADGLSYSQCGTALTAEFGRTFTGSSCIGRADRLGLPKQDKSPNESRPMRRVPGTAGTRAGAVQATSIGVKLNWAKRKAARGDDPTKLPVDDLNDLRTAVVDPLRIDLMDLTDDTCRWPVGGFPSLEPITFCGHLPDDGSPYCPAHRALNRPTDPRTGTTLSPEARANQMRGSKAAFLTCSDTTAEEALA